MGLDSLQQVLEVLDELNVEYKYHSWVNIPSAHRFATWFVTSERFDGADGMVMYEDYTLVIAIYYRKFKDNEDHALERAFESECRGAGHYTKTNGYDSENELFSAVYTFEFKQFIS